MDFKTFVFLLSLATFVSGCANQEFKAEAPEDYKDNAKYGFGSLIKGENSSLKKYFGKGSTADNELAVEKLAEQNPKDRLWNSVVVTLRDFPIEFMDKRAGRISTGQAKVKLFDNTETCTYKIDITLRNASNLNVVVTSNEDSPIRLKKHAETIKAKILQEYKK